MVYFLFNFSRIIYNNVYLMFVKYARLQEQEKLGRCGDRSEPRSQASTLNLAKCASFKDRPVV